MAIETRRGCGYRKVGGKYLVADGLAVPCHRIPFLLRVCPTCSAGIKPARGWTWIRPALLDPSCGLDGHIDLEHCLKCVICSPSLLGERAGLLWIGEKFYPGPQDFGLEAAKLGVSRRVAQIPRGFEVGKTWVLLAHRRALDPAVPGEPSVAGIVFVFRPTHIELILRQSEATPERIAQELAHGITVVAVPDGDPDHDPKGLRIQHEQERVEA